MIVTPETPGAMQAVVIDRVTKDRVEHITWVDTNTGKAKAYAMNEDGSPRIHEDGQGLVEVDHPNPVDVYIPKVFEKFYISDEPIGVNPYREVPE